MFGQRFRFGLVATPSGGEEWAAAARRAYDLGYRTLLMPDVTSLPSVFPSLALAAGAAPIRVGTFVLAAPLRPPPSAAWEAHSMTVLTDGRFELGIGTGLPASAQTARDWGLPGGSMSRRLEQVVSTVSQLRALDGGRRTPVLIAAGGPKAIMMAAALADIVTFAVGPLADRVAVGRLASLLGQRAGARSGEIELSQNVFVIGEEIPPHLQRFLGTDLATLVEHDSLTLLRGTPRQMADELRRRRDAFGTSYVTVNEAFRDRFAPVVELLAGT